MGMCMCMCECTWVCVCVCVSVHGLQDMFICTWVLFVHAKRAAYSKRTCLEGDITRNKVLKNFWNFYLLLLFYWLIINCFSLSDC